MAAGVRRFGSVAALSFATAFALALTGIPTAPDVQAAVTCGTYGGTAVDTDATTGRTICQVDYTSPGTSSWTVPASVTSVQVVLIGGGGAGGATYGGRTAAGGGGGGGVVGGQHTVAPGQVYTVSVPSGGSTGAGGTAQFTGTGGTTTAYGGDAGGASGTDYASNGGYSGNGNVYGLGSNTDASCHYIDVYTRYCYGNVGSGGGAGAGGNGTNGSSSTSSAVGGYGGAGKSPAATGMTWFAGLTTKYGGGGGGGAFTSSGTPSRGYGSDGGGNGGAYNWGTDNGSAGGGSSYGGGGGGAAMSANSGSFAGAYGYSGRVMIRWLLSGPPAAPTISSVSSVSGSSTTLDVAFTLGASDLAYTDVKYSLDGGAQVSMSLTSSGTYRITSLVAGQSYAVRVFGVSSAGTSTASNVVSQSPNAVVPSFSANAAVSGNAWVGQTLTASSTVSGTPTPSLAYQWFTCTHSHTADTALANDCTALTGETGASTTVAAGRLGEFLLVRIRATNAGGGVTNTQTSFSATTDSVITVPSAPTITSVTATGTTSVDVAAELAADTGGSPITDVEYSLNGGSWVSTNGTSGEFTISGLTTDTTYAVRVRAVNTAGNGAASTPSSTTTYAAPVITTATAISGLPGEGHLITGTLASFTGRPTPSLTHAWYLCTDAHQAATTTLPPDCGVISTAWSSSLTISPEFEGQYVLFATTATNSVASVTSYSSTLGPAFTLPANPTILSLTPASTTELLVDADLGDTGNTVTDVQYLLDNGSWESSGGTDGEFTISGLVPGSTHTVRVLVVNAAGSGGASSPATASTFATTPTFTSDPDIEGHAWVGSELTATVVVAGEPTPELSYQWYSCAADHAASTLLAGDCSVIADETESSLSVPAAAFDAYLLVRVSATNSGGGQTNVTTQYSATTSRVIRTPATPTIAALTAVSTTELTVQVDLGSTGGDLDDVEYSLNDGAWVSSQDVDGTFTISGLTPGTEYSVQVRSVNDVGHSAASLPVIHSPLAVAPSFSVHPTVSGVAHVGSTLQASGTNTGTPTPQQSFQWFACDAPHAQDVSLANGCVEIGGATAATLELTNARVRSFLLARIIATNVGGGVTNTLTSYSATTDVVLGAPTAPILSARDAVREPGQITLDVTAPNDQGSAITGYQYSLDPETDAPTWSDVAVNDDSVTITGLTDGSPVLVSLRAVNAIGAGPGATHVHVTPLGGPSAVAGVSANDSITLTWQAPAGGGAVGYHVHTRVSEGDAWTDASGGCEPVATRATTTLNCTMRNLVAGSTHMFRVAAVNENGIGHFSDASAVITVVATSTPTTAAAPLAAQHVAAGTLAEGGFGATDDAHAVTVRSVVGGANTRIDATSEAWNLELESLTAKGKPIPLGPTGVLRSLPGSLLHVHGHGYKPDTAVMVYSLPDEKPLGYVKVAADGTFSGNVTMHTDEPVGAHMLQLNGFAGDGHVLSYTIGFDVTTKSALTHSIGTRVYFTSGSKKLSSATKKTLNAMVAQVRPGTAKAATVIGIRPSIRAGAQVKLAFKRALATAKFLRTHGLRCRMTTGTTSGTASSATDVQRVQVSVAMR